MEKPPKQYDSVGQVTLGRILSLTLLVPLPDFNDPVWSTAPRFGTRRDIELLPQPWLRVSECS